MTGGVVRGQIKGWTEILHMKEWRKEEVKVHTECSCHYNGQIKQPAACSVYFFLLTGSQYKLVC